MNNYITRKIQKQQLQMKWEKFDAMKNRTLIWESLNWIVCTH